MKELRVRPFVENGKIDRIGPGLMNVNHVQPYVLNRGDKVWIRSRVMAPPGTQCMRIYIPLRSGSGNMYTGPDKTKDYTFNGTAKITVRRSTSATDPTQGEVLTVDNKTWKVECKAITAPAIVYGGDPKVQTDAPPPMMKYDPKLGRDREYPWIRMAGMLWVSPDAQVFGGPKGKEGDVYHFATTGEFMKTFGSSTKVTGPDVMLVVSLPYGKFLKAGEFCTLEIENTNSPWWSLASGLVSIEHVPYTSIPYTECTFMLRSSAGGYYNLSNPAVVKPDLTTYTPMLAFMDETGSVFGNAAHRVASSHATGQVDEFNVVTDQGYIYNRKLEVGQMPDPWTFRAARVGLGTASKTIYFRWGGMLPGGAAGKLKVTGVSIPVLPSDIDMDVTWALYVGGHTTQKGKLSRHWQGDHQTSREIPRPEQPHGHVNETPFMPSEMLHFSLDKPVTWASNEELGLLISVAGRGILQFPMHMSPAQNVEDEMLRPRDRVTIRTGSEGQQTSTDPDGYNLFATQGEGIDPPDTIMQMTAGVTTLSPSMHSRVYVGSTGFTVPAELRAYQYVEAQPHYIIHFEPMDA